jgi:hypothetical protein
MNGEKQISTSKRGSCLFVAVSLLLFLILSAPHRVHHFFEQFPSQRSTGLEASTFHDHGDSRHENHSPVPTPTSQQSDCLILTATQNAHALAASLFDLSIFSIAVKRAQIDSSYSASSFNPSPRSQRAPPLV